MRYVTLAPTPLERAEAARAAARPRARLRDPRGGGRGLAQRAGGRARGRRAGGGDPGPARRSLSAWRARRSAALPFPAALLLFLLSGRRRADRRDDLAALAARAARRDGARGLGDPRGVLPRPGARRRRGRPLRAAQPAAARPLRRARARRGALGPRGPVPARCRRSRAAGGLRRGAERARASSPRCASRRRSPPRSRASLAFGATLPALAAAAVGGPHALGRRGAALYGVNTLGAALGTALASFWLPEAVGVFAGYAVRRGAAIAAAGALALGARAALRARSRRAAAGPGPGARAARRSRRSSSRPSRPSRASASSPRRCSSSRPSPWCSINRSTPSAPCWWSCWAPSPSPPSPSPRRSAARIRPRAPSSRRASPRRRSGCAALPGALLRGDRRPDLSRAASGRGPATWRRALGIAAATAGPALLAAGLVFPATIASAGSEGAGGAASARLGRLAAANTLGALAGALAAPWLLLPGLGLWPSFGALAALYAAASLAAARRSQRGRILVAGALLGGRRGAGLAREPLARAAAPRSRPARRSSRASRRAAGLVAVVDRAGELLIQIDNHYALGGSAEAIHEERQAHLALLLRPGARRVAWIGSATGHQRRRGAGASDRAARARRARARRRARRAPALRAVEPRRLRATRAARSCSTTAATSCAPPGSASTRSSPISSCPGRRAPRRSTRASTSPRSRARLAPGGLFCQWLPLYQLSEAELRVVLATFLDVFPHAALFRGDFYGRFPIVALVGYEGAAPSRGRDLGGGRDASRPPA